MKNVILITENKVNPYGKKYNLYSIQVTEKTGENNTFEIIETVENGDGYFTLFLAPFYDSYYAESEELISIAVNIKECAERAVNSLDLTDLEEHTGIFFKPDYLDFWRDLDTIEKIEFSIPYISNYFNNTDNIQHLEF